ncbi:hybrid sensor histidine kinase/response regulator [Fischerella thermalis]|uniref:hybrid sensor histidine kinase/response regulator n=1 Tax=Fischerella thermalis TaxID=372787 RepID=UPI0019EF91C7|nr:response regulator [Fischerella thermalis]MBF1988817.1 response regulator [Fischerella thermalis M58_A2018_009]MBF2060047.1 response regulator [Fischerella thermalis M66_A2018_004]MBF2068356.1 response regulator [Fischerella thermalis M48_A2018_028]
MHLIPQRDYKANILVVDDTPDNLRLLSAMLTSQGYEVRKTLSGKMALTACQMVLPDVILLDINMPEMNGYEVCRQLKANEKTRPIPVIFISALDDVLDKAQAFDVGGVDYITKPFHGVEVVLRIENQLNLCLLQNKLQEKNTLLQKALDDLKASQVQMIQQEKMAALGQLVAGIAHEVNNPISFIYGNLQYASQYVSDLVNLIEVYQQEYPNPTPRIQEIVKQIDLNFLINDQQNLMGAMFRGAERIRSIVEALQNFSRLDEAQMKRVDVHQGIDSTLVMLQHRLKQTTDRPAIEVVKEYGNLPLVTCYVSELNQVFMHLLNNAIDALEESYEPENTNYQLPITNYQLPSIHIRTMLTTSDTVKICIADNGPGVCESVLSRIFDPFFTTKPPGKGSGLGLAISYQIIVQKHQGKLTCASSRGRGAEFMIEIPLKQTQLN